MAGDRSDSVGFRILQRMRRGGRNHVWIPHDFIDIGTRTAVDVALHRLEAKDHVRKISWGLYDLARIERDEVLPPDAAAVLAAIGRRDRVKVLVEEHSAAHRLGLVDIEPDEFVVLTSSHLTPIALGHRTIRFKTVAPRLLVWSGRPAAYLVQAMRHLRSELEGGTAKTWRLKEILDDKSGAAIRKDLERGLGDLPDWLVPHVKKLLRVPRTSNSTSK